MNQFQKLIAKNFETGKSVMVKLMQSFPELRNRWCNSTKVDGNFDYLQQVILLEDFKNCISSNIRTHIDKLNGPTFDVAARMADEYALTHKTKFNVKSKQSVSKGNVNFNQVNKNKSYEGQSSSSSENKSQSRVNKSENNTSRSFSNKFCNYCKKEGHLRSECFNLRNRQDEQKRFHCQSPNRSKKIQLLAQMIINLWVVVCLDLDKMVIYD